MKQKFGLLLFALAATIGLPSFSSNHHLQISPVLAQPTPAEFSLEPMDIERLDAILQEQLEDIATQPGQWRFSINEIPVVVVADVNADRMRIFSPVVNVEKLNPEQIQKMMLANFHTALDARYAISNGFVVTTFIHPLSSLQERDLLSALNQVSSLAATFGTNYSSGELLFVPRSNRANPPSLEQSTQDDLQTKKLGLNSQAVI